MTLVDALIEAMKPARSVTGARTVVLAFADGKAAYLSEIPLEELVPMLEEWCKQRREEMKVH